jgi:hypothetical protein
MVQAACLAIVLMAVLTETTALRQWQRHSVMVGVEQATAGRDFPVIRRQPN